MDEHPDPEPSAVSRQAAAADPVDAAPAEAEGTDMPEPEAPPLPAEEPVTVVISRLVRPGMEREYEQWIHEAAQLLVDFEGSEGFTVLPPGQHHSGPEYVLVLRFHDYAAMARWKQSPARREWIAKLPDLTVDTGAWQEQTGLETWFTLPGRVQPTGPPPRWKQALLTILGLVPLLLLTDLALRPVLGDLPAYLRIPATSPLVVGAMTWLIMPTITRFSYRWLYPGQHH
jgi:uncharacterized protein